MDSNLTATYHRVFVIWKKDMESRLALELAHFNGNYLNRLEEDKLTEAIITQQLQRLANLNCYQVGYVFCPSFPRNDGTLISSRLKPGPSTRFFTNTFGIDGLELVCTNLTSEFNGLFQDSFSITVKNLAILKKILANMSTVVIFSNDATEIEVVCAKIKELTESNRKTREPNSSCFFIVANSAGLDLDIDTNILAQISTRDIETSVDSFNFWKQVRNEINNLADMIPRKEATQKCCAMM